MREPEMKQGCELFIFVALHANAGHEEELATEMWEVIARTREEPGCQVIGGYRSCVDPSMFYIHSRWVDDAALASHGTAPHTVRFIESTKALLDGPMQTAKMRRF
jgi:quinol monooxygenase YgiN